MSLLIKSKQIGFTIVELIVVIVIIGILATITIVSYTGISKQAVVASIKSDLRSAAQQIKLFQFNNTDYPTSLDCTPPIDINSICLKSSPGNSYDAAAYASSVNNSNSFKVFSLTATNASLNSSYVVTNSSAPVEVPPAPPPVLATGGTITNVGGRNIHTFTSNGTFTITNGGNVDISIIGAGGGAGGPQWEGECAAYGNGTAGGLSKISKGGIDWQSSGGGGGAGTDDGYCGGSGTGANGAVGTTNTPSGWTATNGGGSPGGSKYFWGSGADWETYGGNGGAGGKLEKTNLSVASGDAYVITVGAMGQTNGTAGKVIITYTAS